MVRRQRPLASGSPILLELLADLEERFDPLEDWRTGTRVGIGVATGCDDVFVVEDAPAVERCRLLPLLTAPDIASGTPRWSGRFLVNPWEDGRLVDLGEYPGLGSYLQRHGTRVRARHVARKRPASWYRTIDRVDPELQARPKLLLPDLKAAAHPVLDTGGFYPHHKLVLRRIRQVGPRSVGRAPVVGYREPVRWCLLREDARWHLPIPGPVPEEDPSSSPDAIDAPAAAALAHAFRNRDRATATDAAAALYGISNSNLLGVAA